MQAAGKNPAADALFRQQEQIRQQQQQAKNVHSQVQRFVGPPSQINRRQGEPTAATPEAAATALVSGFILGPVGGVALGLAQGLMQKRAAKNTLDLIAERDAVAQESDAYNRAWFNDQMLATQGDPFAEAELEDMQTMYDRMQILDGSPDTQDQAQAKALGQELDKRMSTWQRSLRDNRMAEDLALATEQKADYTRIKTDYNNYSSPKIDQIYAGDQALQALQSDDASAQVTALQLFAKSLDSGQVTEEDRQAVSGFLGFLDSQLQKYEQFMEGGVLLPEANNQLQRTVKLIQNGLMKQLRFRETNAKEELIDFGVDQSLYDNFNFSSRIELTPLRFKDPGDTSANRTQSQLETIPEKLRGLEDEADARIYDVLDAAGVARDEAYTTIFDAVDAYQDAARSGYRGMQSTIESAYRAVQGVVEPAGEAVERAVSAPETQPSASRRRRRPTN